jgi:hypothetical protein
MRDVYYQPVGNPLQLDRLPSTRPEMEMLPPELPFGDRLSQVARTLALAAAAAFGILVLCCLGTSWIEPYDLIFAGVITAVVFAVVLITCQWRWILHPLFLAAAAVLCVNQRIPWTAQCLILSAAIGILAYCYGQHWAHVCTAVPTARAVARVLRPGWQFQLVIMAAIGALVTGAMLLSGWTLLKIALLTLPVVAFFSPPPEALRTSRWRAVLNSLASWITYDAQPFPGLLQSPVGPAHHRRALTIFAAAMAAVVLIRWEGSPLPTLLQFVQSQHESITQQLAASGASNFERLRYGLLTCGVIILLVTSLPVLLPHVFAISLAMPTLMDASANRDQANATKGTETILADVRTSPDPTERDSVYLGRVVADGSPVLVPRDVFREHAHALGDSGAGKTSLFLCPLIEQLVRLGDCSVIVLDLKADTLELLAALRAAAEAVRRERGLVMPLRTFSNQAGMATFAFNPMTQPFWPNFDLLTKTDILCGANGLTYGTDYGAGFYSSANAANMYQALKTFPHVTTFKELADCIGHVITTAKKSELHPEIRKAGVHVHEVIKRLAACEPLNVTDATGHAVDVVEQTIDLAQVFQQPQLLYFHLSATLSPTGAPEIARLVNYMLLAAATQTKRRHPVFLVIDEFQRVVAANLEYMLQLARSMGVGVILANQCMEDLKKTTTNLIPAIEANCRLRQWFSVSCSEDQDRLIHSSGETIDRAITRSVSTNSVGHRTEAYSETEQVVRRFTMNDVLITNDHPFRSFLRISRGAGYAQHGGLPVIIESSYHISEAEYRRRRALPWPTESGTFVPRRNDGQGDKASPPPSKPVLPEPEWTEETIGEDSKPLSEADAKALESLYQQFQPPTSAKTPSSRRNRK